MPPKRGPDGKFVRAAAEEAIARLTVDPEEIPEEERSAWQEIKDQMRNAEIDLHESQKRIEEFTIATGVHDASLHITKIEAEAELLKAKKEIEKLRDDVNYYQRVRETGLYTDDVEISIKVAKPEPFDGESRNVDSFLTACELVFHTQTKKFENPKAKVYYALSYCTKGAAANWKEDALRDPKQFLLDIAKHQEDLGCTPWEAFKELFNMMWKGVTNKMEAQVALQRIKQGNDSVKEYFVKFKLLSSQVDFNEEASLLFFKRGLKEPIKQRIYNSGNIPTGLIGWYNRASEIDAAWREGELERSYSAKAWEKKPARARATEERRERLPDDVYQKRRKEGLCYKCGNKGHLAKSCFAKGRKAQPKETDETSDQQDF